MINLIAISVYDAQSLEGYQIKGTAEYVTEGIIVDTFKAMVEKMFNGAATAKGALIITPSKVIVTTPGAENKKYKKKLEDDIRCPLEYGLAIFGGKWKSRIICVYLQPKNFDTVNFAEKCAILRMQYLPQQ